MKFARKVLDSWQTWYIQTANVYRELHWVEKVSINLELFDIFRGYNHKHEYKQKVAHSHEVKLTFYSIIIIIFLIIIKKILQTAKAVCNTIRTIFSLWNKLPPQVVRWLLKDQMHKNYRDPLTSGGGICLGFSFDWPKAGLDRVTKRKQICKKTIKKLSKATWVTQPRYGRSFLVSWEESFTLLFPCDNDQIWTVTSISWTIDRFLHLSCGSL